MALCQMFLQLDKVEYLHVKVQSCSWHTAIPMADDWSELCIHTCICMFLNVLALCTYTLYMCVVLQDVCVILGDVSTVQRLAMRGFMVGWSEAWMSWYDRVYILVDCVAD